APGAGGRRLVEAHALDRAAAFRRLARAGGCGRRTTGRRGSPATADPALTPGGVPPPAPRRGGRGLRQPRCSTLHGACLVLPAAIPAADTGRPAGAPA